MRERDLIKDTLSMCDDIDARLSAAKPRPLTGEDVAREFRDCLIFAAVAGVVIVALLSAGGV